MKSRTIIPALLACVVGSLVLTACGTFTNPGAPDQSFDIDQDIQDLEDAFKENGVTIISYYSTVAKKATAAAAEAKTKAEKATKKAAEAKAAAEKATKEAEKAQKEAAEAKAAAKKPTKEEEEATAKDTKRGLRDQFISQRLTLINIQYIKFIRKFAVNKAQLDTAADMLVIGVNLAGTLVGSAATKGILAAISGGTSASRTSINKNFFHEKTVPVLVTAMNAERKKALVPIFVGIGKSIDEYPFARALSDLHLYYQAGTFIGALQSIQKDSGAKEKQADRDLTFVRNKDFVEKSRQERVGKILENIVGLSKKAALDLIQNLPVKDAKIEKLIQLRDPTGQRTSNEDVAKEMLKMAAVMGERDDEALDAWEAAVRAAQ